MASDWFVEAAVNARRDAAVSAALAGCLAAAEHITTDAIAQAFAAAEASQGTDRRGVRVLVRVGFVRLDERRQRPVECLDQPRAATGPSGRMEAEAAQAAHRVSQGCLLKFFSRERLGAGSRKLLAPASSRELPGVRPPRRRRPAALETTRERRA